MSDMKDNLSLAILLGGMSKRMGSDKSQLKVGESTFLEHLVKELDFFREKYFSVNSTREYHMEGFANIEDAFPGVGPLGGIYSVLKAGKNEYVFFTACDMPKLSREAVKYLIDNWNGEDMCIATTKRGREPLVGIYGKACIPVIEDLIAKGIHKPIVIADYVSSKFVDMSSFEECFDNINTFEDYLRIENRKI